MRMLNLASFGLCLALVGGWLNLYSQTPVTVPLAGAAAETQVVSTLLPTGVQQIVVVDTKTQVMAVYQVEPTGGKIQLKSVRNVRLDLAMQEFNATEPLPSQMQQLLKP